MVIYATKESIAGSLAELTQDSTIIFSGALNNKVLAQISAALAKTKHLVSLDFSAASDLGDDFNFWELKGDNIIALTLPDILPATHRGIMSHPLCIDLPQLRAINVTNNNQVFTSKDGILYSKDGKKLLRCPKGKSHVNIPQGVKEIGNLAFSGCGQLKEITIPEGVTHIVVGAFAGCTGLSEIVLPSSVTWVGDDAFGGCKNLKSVTLPNNIEELNLGAFCQCSKLRRLLLPEKVREISGGDGWFGDNSLEELVVTPNNQHFSSKDGLIYTKDGKKLILCPAAKEKVTLSKEVAAFGKEAFMYCKKLKSLMIDEDNPCFTVIDGILYSKDRKRLIHCLRTKEAANILPGVTTIEENAFSGCKKLKKVALPAGLTTIKDAAFWRCMTLETLEIPLSVTHIGAAAFWCCFSLKKITLPKELAFLGAQAFMGAKSLEKIEIPEGITAIAYSTFEWCPKLKRVKLPKSLTFIGDLAFNCCAKLEHIKIPQNVNVIDEGAFSGCRSLKSIVIPQKVTAISDNLFEGAIKLSKVTLPKGIKIIGKNAFEGAIALKEIKIPRGVTNIGAEAFLGCKKLKKVILAADTQVAENAFDEGCQVVRRLGASKTGKTPNR